MSTALLGKWVMSISVNSGFVKTKIDINEEALQHKVEELINDRVMLEIHNLFAKMCDPYVPMLEGPLHESGLAQVTPNYVRYGGTDVPYAHYQYYGVNFNHTLEKHPKATAMWDKVMMSEQGELFTKQVEDILKRRARELYG